MHPRNIVTRFPVRSVVDDLAVPASDQDIPVGATGEIIMKIESCIVCIIEQE